MYSHLHFNRRARATWQAGYDMPAWVYGASSAFLVWFGFIVSLQLNGIIPAYWR